MPLVESVVSPDGVVAVSWVVFAGGVFFMSSVRVELDELGVVEVCAASKDTEKHSAAAVIISFFIAFHLLVKLDRICLRDTKMPRLLLGFSCQGPASR